MLAVSLVLLLIIISGRFVHYLAEAATGTIDANVLFSLMGFRLPSFLELILPLGLFIGILLAYGRLYVESEMTVLFACGFSEKKLIGYTLITASFVAALVAVFSIYLAPMGVKASEALLAEQRSRAEFETIKPARFHKLSDGEGVSYIEGISSDKKQLQGVFLAGTGGEQSKFSVVTAESGESIVDNNDGKRYLLLKDGYQYHGRPGDLDYEVTSFGSFKQFVPENEVRPKKATDSLSTSSLLALNTSEAQAALQWRFSLPALVMIIALLAVPLSKTQPRRGRYVKMIPAILLYIVYLVAINAARGLLEEGKAPSLYVLWYVHAVFLLFALILIGGKDILSFKGARSK